MSSVSLQGSEPPLFFLSKSGRGWRARTGHCRGRRRVAAGRSCGAIFPPLLSMTRFVGKLLDGWSLEHVDIRILGGPAEALDLQAVGALGAETVDADAVLLDVDQGRDPRSPQ